MPATVSARVADTGQGVTHLVELERLDDGGHQLHDLSSCLRAYADRLASAREDVKRDGEKMARREARRALRNRRDTDAAGGGT
jgi:hypothetical protein